MILCNTLISSEMLVFSKKVKMLIELISIYNFPMTAITKELCKEYNYYSENVRQAFRRKLNLDYK